MDEVRIALFRHEKLRKEVLNISNIPAITQIVLNMEIVGQVEILDKEEEYNKLDPNPLQSKKVREMKKRDYAGVEGQESSKQNNEFRKKLMFSNVPP